MVDACNHKSDMIVCVVAVVDVDGRVDLESDEEVFEASANLTWHLRSQRRRGMLQVSKVRKLGPYYKRPV